MDLVSSELLLRVFELILELSLSAKLDTSEDNLDTSEDKLDSSENKLDKLSSPILESNSVEYFLA